MKYRIFWSPHAESKLSALLGSTTGAETVVDIVRQINAALASDPIGFGESRYDTVRIGYIKPLGVQYDVLVDVTTLIVDDIWRTDLRRQTR